VLCYHRIGGPLELGVTRVSAGTFRRQMTALAEAGWRALTLSQYTEAIHTAHRAPRTFLLSFDDGYAALAEHAFPVLADLGYTATTFVITDFIGRTNTWDIPYAFQRLPHLDWEAIERWQARGFDFQSHGARHERLTWLDDAAVSDDLDRSRQTLLRRLGPEAGRAVAYPFGAVDARVARLAAAAGYELGFQTGNGDRGTRNGKTELAPAVPRSALRIPRSPVYVWDAFGTPFGLRADAWGAVGRGVAATANRCAVGTTAMLRLGRAGLGLLRLTPQRDGQEDRAG
jgi:peptidoglycan/xylan/chitin deacetylase (PgdA/CDA1 family)